MTEPPALRRPAWVAVDLEAIRANVRSLAAAAAPAALLATVKADAYGHGAVPVARAAIDAGASFLGVAFVDEGIELRDAGIDAPILLFSEPPVTAAGFDARSRAVLTREADGTVRRWECELCGGLDELVPLGEARLRATGRSLTADERARYLD